MNLRITEENEGARHARAAAPTLRTARKRKQAPAPPPRVLTVPIDPADATQAIDDLRRRHGDGTLVVFPHQEKVEKRGVIRWSGCVYVVSTGDAGRARELASRMHTRDCVRGARAQIAAQGPLSKLTRRERQVLGLLADGATSKHIAETLGISPRTVGAHRSSVMKKLRIRSLAGLVRLAVREGLTEESFSD